MKNLTMADIEARLNSLIEERAAAAQTAAPSVFSVAGMRCVDWKFDGTLVRFSFSRTMGRERFSNGLALSELDLEVLELDGGAYGGSWHSMVPDSRFRKVAEYRYFITGERDLKGGAKFYSFSDSLEEALEEGEKAIERGRAARALNDPWVTPEGKLMEKCRDIIRRRTGLKRVNRSVELRKGTWNDARHGYTLRYNGREICLA